MRFHNSNSYLKQMFPKTTSSCSFKLGFIKNRTKIVEYSMCVELNLNHDE